MTIVEVPNFSNDHRISKSGMLACLSEGLKVVSDGVSETIII